eukprot:sb/3475592/
MTENNENNNEAAKKPVDKKAQQDIIDKIEKELKLPKAVPKTEDDAKRRNYQFWSTQPVPSFSSDAQGRNGPIEEDKEQSEVRQESFSLVKGFEWCNLDLDDESQLIELYQLLNENYVEDDDNMFR